MHAALSGQGSGSQQERRCWNRQSSLLDQDPHEEQGITVTNYEFERLSHGIQGSNADLVGCGSAGKVPGSLQSPCQSQVWHHGSGRGKKSGVVGAKQLSSARSRRRSTGLSGEYIPVPYGRQTSYTRSSAREVCRSFPLQRLFQAPSSTALAADACVCETEQLRHAVFLLMPARCLLYVHLQQDEVGILAALGKPGRIDWLPQLLRLYMIAHQLTPASDRDISLAIGIGISQIDTGVNAYGFHFLS